MLCWAPVNTSTTLFHHCLPWSTLPRSTTSSSSRSSSSSRQHYTVCLFYFAAAWAGRRGLPPSHMCLVPHSGHPPPLWTPVFVLSKPCTSPVIQSPPKGATIPYRPKPTLPPVLFAGNQAFPVQGQYALQQPDVSTHFISVIAFSRCWKISSFLDSIRWW